VTNGGQIIASLPLAIYPSRNEYLLREYRPTRGYKLSRRADDIGISASGASDRIPNNAGILESRWEQRPLFPGQSDLRVVDVVDDDADDDDNGDSRAFT
jgi:hypothetical protein